MGESRCSSCGSHHCTADESCTRANKAVSMGEDLVLAGSEACLVCCSVGRCTCPDEVERLRARVAELEGEADRLYDALSAVSGWLHSTDNTEQGRARAAHAAMEALAHVPQGGGEDG